MPRSGSGAYTLPEAAYVYGTVIDQDSVNSNLADIANALTNSLAKNGETNPTANLPMATFRHTGVGAASALTDYARADQVQNSAFSWGGTAGGTANALTITPSPAISAYAAGQVFRFKVGSSVNTGAATLAVSGLAAKAIERGGEAVRPGDLPPNAYVGVLYDGTAFQLVGEWRPSVVTPFDFGAVEDPGDGSTDSGAALTAMFRFLRDSIDESYEGIRYSVDGLGRLFCTTTSIDATAIVRRGWSVRDLQIWGKCTGKPVLDFSGSRRGLLSNVYVWGDRTNEPSVGFLFGRCDTEVVNSVNVSTCTHHTLLHCTAYGDFDQAALHVRSAENMAAFGCTFENLKQQSDGDGEAWAAIFDGNGSKAVVSDYRTGWTGGRASFTVNNYTACRFTKPNGQDGPSVFMVDMANFQFNQCYVTNGSGSAIVWQINAAFDPYSVRLDCQVETTGNENFIEFDGVSGNPDCTINGLEILNGNMYTEDNYFLLSNFGTGSLSINNLRIQVNRWQDDTKPTNLVNGASLLSIFGGHIVTPGLADVSLVGLAAYEGWQIALDGTSRHYGAMDKRTGALTSYYGHLFETGAGAKVSIADDDVHTITLADDDITDAGEFIFWSRQTGVAARISYRANATPIILLETLGTNVETATGTTLTGTTGNDTKVTIAINDGEIQIENRRGSTISARWAFVAG